MFDAWAQRLVSPLDSIRFALLRVTMRYQGLRLLYLRRANRLLVQHTLMCALYLFLALQFPNYLLMLGPLFLGIPHLVSSMRYLPRMTLGSSSRGLSICIMLLSAYGLFNFLFARNYGVYLSQKYFALCTIAASLCFIVVFALIKGRHLRDVLTIRRGVVLGLIVAGLCFFNSYLIPALLIGHNLIAYAFWYRSAKSTQEKQTAILAFALVAFIHIGFLGGAFDAYAAAGLDKKIFGIDLVQIGSQIALPFTLDFKIFVRVAMAYAFGQAVHYFVWLKAIPEQHLNKQSATAFSESYRLLKRDIGMLIPMSALALILSYVALSLFVRFSSARDLYILFAAYHGYAEIAAYVTKGPTPNHAL